MRLIHNFRPLIHGQEVLGKWPEFHGLFVQFPSRDPVSGCGGLDRVRIDAPPLGGFSGYIDHFLKELQDVIFIGQGVKADVGRIFLSYQTGDGVDEYGFSIAAAADQKECRRRGQGFMKRVTDRFLDEVYFLLVIFEYFLQELNEPGACRIGVIIIGQKIGREDVPGMGYQLAIIKIIKTVLQGQVFDLIDSRILAVDQGVADGVMDQLIQIGLGE